MSGNNKYVAVNVESGGLFQLFIPTKQSFGLTRQIELLPVSVLPFAVKCLLHHEHIESHVDWFLIT